MNNEIYTFTNDINDLENMKQTIIHLSNSLITINDFSKLNKNIANDNKFYSKYFDNNNNKCLTEENNVVNYINDLIDNINLIIEDNDLNYKKYSLNEITLSTYNEKKFLSLIKKIDNIISYFK